MQTRKHSWTTAAAGASTTPAKVFAPVVVSMTVQLSVADIGDHLHATLEAVLKGKHEGRCIAEGYVKPDSVKLLSFSSGLIERGNIAVFKAAVECLVCFPVEGTLLSCVVRDVTKAGVRAEIAGESPSPMVVFVAKDHHFNQTHFHQVNVGDVVTVRVIGQRFELNDKVVSVIGELTKDAQSGGTGGGGNGNRLAQTFKRPRLQVSH